MAHNILQSLLLRLPAELRNKTCDLVYGDQDLIVRLDVCDPREETWTVSYWIRQDEPRFRPTELPCLPCLPCFLCKQFWAESVSVVYSRAVFGSKTFRAFAIFATTAATQAFIPRVHRVYNCSRITDYRQTGSYPGSFLQSTAVDRFESLESLEWTLDLSSCARDNNELLQNLDVMESMVWRECNVPSIVRAFQRRILRKDLTLVMVRTGDTTAQSDVICKSLLQTTS
jgi:hypothetical protein